MEPKVPYPKGTKLKPTTPMDRLMPELRPASKEQIEYLEDLSGMPREVFSIYDSEQANLLIARLRRGSEKEREYLLKDIALAGH